MGWAGGGMEPSGSRWRFHSISVCKVILEFRLVVDFLVVGGGGEGGGWWVMGAQCPGLSPIYSTEPPP